MRKHTFLSATLTSLLALATLTGPASAEGAGSARKLLSVDFESRQVVKVEAGNFYFKRGQLAPTHSHVAPAIGYIAKGTIFYQAEGEEARLLREGDAFYEPTGQRILHFDNASATEDAIFVDFNLQQEGEPFILFEKPPSEAIDRRALPTATLDGASIDGADSYAHKLQPGGRESLDSREPLFGYVAEGEVELRIEGKAPKRVKARESFYRPKGSSESVIVNVSSTAPAKVITFNIH